jgi:predicted GNAT family N-acyltransferase
VCEDLEVLEVDAEVVHPLRTSVLRPHYREGRLAEFDGDEAPTTHHFAIGPVPDGSDSIDEPSGVVSYIQQAAPEGIEARAPWRLRGMAVDPEVRSEGLGSRLLEASLSRLAVLEPSCDVIWCQARMTAADFYAQHGFERTGEPFEIPQIGRHVTMWRQALQAMASGR